jgi:prepilin signal peptidase PulO-like enzyme (type II secretory pathway)
MLLAAAPREPLLPLWTMELLASTFLYAWLFCVGACVGSFLNVVVYRLPRRKNLAHPGSRCPRCGHAIRLLDNIPILSWLALGGRCRDCKSPIALRYFFVELAVATIFLGVALIETKLTGSFPRRMWDTSRLLISPYETLPFWSAYALHVVLLTTLLGAALIDYDGFRTPRQLFVPVILLAIAMQVTWLSPRDVPSWVQAFEPGWQRDLMTSLFGLATGIAAGVVVAVAWRIATRHWPRFAPVMLLAAIGVVTGWRGVLEIGALSAVFFAAAMLTLRTSRANAIAPLAGIVLLAALPRIVDLDLRLSLPLVWPASLQVALAAGCAAVIAFGSLAAGLLATPPYFAPPPVDPPPVELAPAIVSPPADEAGAAQPLTADATPPDEPPT